LVNFGKAFALGRIIATSKLINMKKVIAFFSMGILMVTASIASRSNTFNEVGPAPAIEFTETAHDFGTVKQSSPVEYNFVFKNTGMAPLIINNVEKTCGCTTPEYTTQPVAPGKTGKIKVKYDSERVGAFQKSVIVHTNDPDNATISLKISGVIEPK
jgi:hypothetical protein